MTRDAKDTLSLDLFAEETPVDAQAYRMNWPDPARFPLNVDRRHVGDRVLEDLRASQEPLIVTGYAALDHLIDFIAETPEDGHLRLLLGFEPFPSRRESFEVHGYSFPREVERYWLERGISMVLSAKLIQCIERLKSGQVRARYLSDRYRRLHAKIYVADPAATVGSSNFTRSGFKSQLEANARFDRIHEPKRYAELREIADNYWSLGREYNDELIALLDRLLRVVSWREALARASAELLEGDWAQDFLQADYLPGDAQLWPSQLQGIAQALYVLSRQGSVLVADATGSGKTLMGSHLVRAILDHIAGSGRLRKGRAMRFNVVVANPPFSLDKWGAAEAQADRYNRFWRGVPPKSKGDYAFVTHMIETALPQEGRVAVVVPHGVLFRGGAEGRIRRALIEENLLDAVIGLPGNLFPTTSIPVAILVFDRAREKGGAREDCRDVLFIDASRDFQSGKNQNALLDEHIARILETFRARQPVDKYAHVASLQEIADNDFNLNIPRYVDTFEEEEEIDVAAVEQEIERLEGELAEVRTRMKQYLRELGV